MKIEYKIYVVTDTHGNKDANVVNESCDIVQVCGMLHKDMTKLYFEEDAYHLDSWCELNGLELQVIDMTAEV